MRTRSGSVCSQNNPSFRDVLAVSQDAPSRPRRPASRPRSTLDKGANNGGVFALNIPRRDSITEHVGGRACHGRRHRHLVPAGNGRAARTHLSAGASSTAAIHQAAAGARPGAVSRQAGSAEMRANHSRTCG